MSDSQNRDGQNGDGRTNDGQNGGRRTGDCRTGDGRTQVFHPGEIVPDSGIYECDCQEHHGFSTDVRGHRFPPPPPGCSGHGWRLVDAAHPHG